MYALIKIFDVKAKNNTELYQQITDYPWFEWMAHDTPFSIRTRGESIVFPNPQFLTLKVKDAIIDKYISKYRTLKRLRGIEPVTNLNCDEAADRAERTFTTIKVRLEVRQVDEALQDVIRELRIVEDKGLELDELVVRKQQLTRRKRELLGSTLRSLG